MSNSTGPKTKPKPKPKPPKPKFYAVRRGRKPGVYRSWSQCQAQTTKFNGAIFKSFKTLQEANLFLQQQKLHRIVELETSDIHHCNETNKKNKRKRSSKEEDDDDDDHEDNNRFPTKVLSLNLHFDGGSRGNPGIGGAGAQIDVSEYDNDTNNDTRKKMDVSNSPQSKKEIKIRHFCGKKCTNNVAEYNGLLCGLHEATKLINLYNSELSVDDHVLIKLVVKGDSMLVINQMNGVYQCKSKSIKSLYDECNRIVESLRQLSKPGNGKIVRISFSHIYRNQNGLADKLANEAMDAKKSWKEQIIVLE